MKYKHLLAGLAALAWTAEGRATDVTGTVQLQGQIVFAAPIAGITETDIEVSVKDSSEPTGNGEHCDVLATTSDNADGLGAYPDLGTVSIQITIGRGGPMVPDGDCIITVQARGTDGVSVSAHGSQTVFLTAADIGSSATVVVPTITVRQSKAIAGTDTDCLKWMKKQLIKRAKCNFLLLKKGPSAALKCKDAGPEPLSCDPGDFVEAVLALSHDSNDQQTDPMNAEGVDYTLLGDQVKCQKRFGKAAAKFVAARNKYVQTKCVASANDTETCRNSQSNAAKPKLDQIDKCVGDQMVDGGTGRIVPDVAAPVRHLHRRPRPDRQEVPQGVFPVGARRNVGRHDRRPARSAATASSSQAVGNSATTATPSAATAAAARAPSRPAAPRGRWAMGPAATSSTTIAIR
jgi:hypothetical protein